MARDKAADGGPIHVSSPMFEVVDDGPSQAGDGSKRGRIRLDFAHDQARPCPRCPLQWAAAFHRGVRLSRAHAALRGDQAMHGLHRRGERPHETGGLLGREQTPHQRGKEGEMKIWICNPFALSMLDREMQVREEESRTPFPVEDPWEYLEPLPRR